MENKSLLRVFSNSKLDKAEILIPGKAVYLRKKTSLKISNSTKYDHSYYEYIFLLHNENRVGGILYQGNGDLHFYIFQKYRNCGFLSEFMRSGWIKKRWPQLKSITCVNYEEKDKIKHLAELADLYVRESRF